MSEGKATVHAQGGLNVRKGAGKKYDKIGLLDDGATVDYYGEHSGWLQIQYSGRTGYIMKSFTNTTGGATSASPSSTSGGSTGDVKFDVDKAVKYNKKQSYSTALWKQIQSKVGVTPDGIPGKDTARAIAQWQGNNGLTADGMCGAGTLQAMNLSGGTTTAGPAPSPHTDDGSSSGSSSVKFDVDAAVEYNRGRNYTSDTWKQIQRKVDVHADGDPGPNTANAIATWQGKHGLKADGMCGDGTLKKMGITAKTDSGSTGGSTHGSGRKNGHTRNYKQYSNPWGPKLYSITNDPDQTYAKSGCGPTAVASVIASAADSSVNPETLGKWAIANGCRTKNDGTNGRKFVPGVCKKYGMSATRYTGASGIQKGLEALQNGKYAVATVGPGYWTKNAHFITPYDFDGDTVYVDDPGHSSRPNGFKQNKKDFISECGAFYVIS